MLNTQKLQTSILSALTHAAQVRDPAQRQASIEAYAKAMAEAIEAYVKGAEVLPGIEVKTTGSASAQVGATTKSGRLQ